MMQNEITDILDIKVGYACNNNCLHCVVRPNQYRVKNFGIEDNFRFEEIENLVKSKPRNTVRKIVVTGGEPSIRNDFPEIINMIFDYHPDAFVEVQTNGRGLKRHLPKIVHHENLSFAIALHGDNEKMHNAVVGTATVTRNPFKETTESIKEIIRLCGDSHKIIFKIVLNSINYKHLKDIVEFVAIQYGAKNISISYPHMDGFYGVKESEIIDFKNFCHPLIAKSDVKNGEDIVKIIGFSYSDFLDYLKETMDFIKTKPDIDMSLEAIPLCAFNQNGIHYEIPSNIHLLTNIPEKAEIHYTNNDINDFHTAWVNMHVHPEEICSKCKFCCECCGLWEETYAVFGTEGLVPYTE